MQNMQLLKHSKSGWPTMLRKRAYWTGTAILEG